MVTRGLEQQYRAHVPISLSGTYILMVAVQKQWPSSECYNVGLVSYLSDKILFPEHCALTRVIIRTPKETEILFHHFEVA